ncbi:MAG TPA: hypothetical protein VFN11_02385 [Ktedonobacterales bacterium]|nr:hypothetical protein [Ktedonobacterales bacterium]
MVIGWLAVLGASIVTAIMVGLALLFGRQAKAAPRELALWALRLWIFNLILDLIILYLAEPAITGPYWGGQWLIWPLLLTGGFALFGGGVDRVRSAVDDFTHRINAGEFPLRTQRTQRRSSFRVVDQNAPAAQGVPASPTAGTAAIALALIVALLVNGLITISTTWFDGNAKALAAIPRIIEEPSSTPLPPTDVNHIVLVTQGVASYLGQQVLAANGQNLGSVYHTIEEEYTLQSVRGHLYWIAPLVYNNVWANIGRWETPGYVQVDAEDPNSPPQLKTGFHLRYLPDAILNQDLIRHVYLSGYTNGDLADPTLEVNDAGTPYFTISLMQPTRGFTGDVVKQVLLVDPQSGAITTYAPGSVPAWVDRIIPADTVNDYLTWWGKYKKAPWFNPSGAGQQAPSTATPELVYNQVDQPVWLEPMTSNNGTDNSSTGVMLFDTKDKTGRFYPLNGLGATANVETTFTSNPANIRNYLVGNVQLYQIYNEPTWVATFVQKNDFGGSFQAVGIVDARHLNGANVIMASTKSEALAQYAQWLADNNVAGTTPTPSGKSVTITGRVTRINAATERGTTVYSMLLDGQTHIFKAGLALSPELPLVQPGDAVTVTFLDTQETVVTLTAFNDSSIHVGGPPPTPVATATP